MSRRAKVDLAAHITEYHTALETRDAAANVASRSNIVLEPLLPTSVPPEPAVEIPTPARAELDTRSPEANLAGRDNIVST